MSEEENQLDLLEKHFVQISGSAFAAAREKVLAAGHSVVEAEDGSLIEVFPDGHRVFIKHIEPSVHFKVGTVLKLR